MTQLLFRNISAVYKVKLNSDKTEDVRETC